MKRWNEFLDEPPSADFENRLLAEVSPLIEEKKKNQSADSWWRIWMGLAPFAAGLVAWIWHFESTESGVEHDLMAAFGSDSSELVAEDLELLDDIELLEEWEILEKWNS